MRLLGIAVAVAGLSLGNDMAVAAVPGVLGYINPVTHDFHILLPTSPAAANVSYTGTIDSTMTVSVVSSIPASQVITCSLTMTAVDTAFNSFLYVLTSPATRDGNTATCTLTLPYAFLLQPKATYTVSYTANTSNADGTAARYVNLPTPAAAPVPAANTVIKLKASAVI